MANSRIPSLRLALALRISRSGLATARIISPLRDLLEEGPLLIPLCHFTMEEVEEMIDGDKGVLDVFCNGGLDVLHAFSEWTTKGQSFHHSCETIFQQHDARPGPSQNSLQ